MININLTLIIQMVNFLVAYVIIRFLLLKPAIAVINQEQEQATRNQEIIHTSKQAIEAKADTIQRRWVYCQQECHHIAPPATQDEESLLGQEQAIAAQVPTVNLKAQEQLVNDVTQKLVQRMSNVR